RPETLKDGNRADAIRNVKRGDLDRALGVGGPCGQFASGNTQEPAARVEPIGRKIVFDNPVDGIAGQSVRRGEGRDSSVRYPIKTIFGCSPKRTVAIRPKLQHPRRACMVFAQWHIPDLARAPIGDAAADQTCPDTAVLVRHKAGAGSTADFLPRYLFSDFSVS